MIQYATILNSWRLIIHPKEPTIPLAPNIITFINYSTSFTIETNNKTSSRSLESRDFGEMTCIVKAVAQRHADSKIISVLEGGYNPNALAECVESHLEELRNT